MRDILGIMVDVNLIEEAGKETLEIVVEPYPSPVSYKGEYYYRSGSTKQELKGAALDRFLLRKLGLHWDGVPVPYVTLADLDATVLRRFREQAVVSHRLSPAIFRESDAQLLDKLRLIAGRYLKRAAVLLFHPDPERFVTGAFIKIGYFRTNSELLFHDTIHGDLFAQIDKTMDLMLTKYLKAMISYEGVQRVETYPVPEEALREALLNAVTHKDYSSGVPIQISVYEDKMLFWNNGELYENWTVDTLLQKHSSQPFNPDVAHTFFRAGMIEAWGRGIEHMIDACKAAEVPVPLLRYETPGLWVEFPIRLPQRPVKIGGGTTPKTTPKTTQKILAILVENPSASRREIAERLADITADGVKYHLDRLKADGKIRRIGPARGGRWEVKEDAHE